MYRQNDVVMSRERDDTALRKHDTQQDDYGANRFVPKQMFAQENHPDDDDGDR